MSIPNILFLFVLTFVASLGIIKYSEKLRHEGIKSVMKSQSTIYTKTKNVLPRKNKYVNNNSQSKNFVSERAIKIISLENKAYWVKDNIFFTADMINGRINHNTTKEVNTMNMSKEDLDKMIFIIDSLKDDRQ